MDNSPIIVTNIPPITDIIIEVCTAFRIVSSFCCPIAFAITTFAPNAIPIKKLSIRPIIGAFAPTAATATTLAPRAKLPTMAISEALKICSKIPVAATGRAYCISLFQIGP